jgi:hypothetical protein
MEDFAEKLGAGCVVALGGVLMVFIMVILSTFLGGVSGWVVGGVFPYVTDTVRAVVGVELTNFQLGATLGFFGGFFRSVST